MEGTSELSLYLGCEGLQLRGRVSRAIVVPDGLFPCPYYVGGSLVSDCFGEGLKGVEQELGIFV